MKYALIAALVLLPFTVQAATHIGSTSCNYKGAGTAGPCGTTQKMINFGQTKAARKLGCYPNDGKPCNAVQGTTYVMGIDRNITDYCDQEHFIWRGTAFFVPSNPSHFMTWTNVTVTGPQACQHDHTCSGQDPFN